jgi:methyl-accepting chemotaxis protein
LTTELVHLQEDIKTVSQKVDSLYEKISRYLSIAESSPTNALFIAGVKSSLDHMSRHVHKTNEEVQQFLSIVNEMKAVVDEIHISTRLVRNRIYCLAGEKEQMEAAKEFKKISQSTEVDKDAPGKDVAP